MNVPARWLLQPEPAAATAAPKDYPYSEFFLENILMSAQSQSISTEEREQFLNKYFSELPEEKITAIAEMTIGQWENDLYEKFHKFRITGSIFGLVLGAINRKSYPHHYLNISWVTTKPEE